MSCYKGTQKHGYTTANMKLWAWMKLKPGAPWQRKSFPHASPVLILEVCWYYMRRKEHPTKKVFCKIGIRKGHPQLIDWFGMSKMDEWPLTQSMYFTSSLRALPRPFKCECIIYVSLDTRQEISPPNSPPLMRGGIAKTFSAEIIKTV